MITPAGGVSHRSGKWRVRRLGACALYADRLWGSDPISVLFLMIFGGDTPAKKLQEGRELPTSFFAPDLVDLLHGLRVV